MPEYMTQAEYRKLKTALTRAVNAKDPAKIIATCDKALARFDEVVAPDDWIRWQRAKEDAQWASRLPVPIPDLAPN